MEDDRFSSWQMPEIEEGKLTRWNWMVQGKNGLILGEKTDIGAFSYINARNGVSIGDNVQIGSHCSLYSESTIDGKKGKVTIGKNAVIGSHSTIMPGITIGENAVIGAHSFVNKDIPADSIAFGVPAKIQEKQVQSTQDKTWKQPLFKIYSDEKDVDAVAEVIKRGSQWANGPEVAEFEALLADYHGKKHALAFNSGTSALHALIAAYGLKGKEVIVPSFTFISTVNAVVLAGATPVFADSESTTMGLSADDVEQKISERTGAIIALHYAGMTSSHIESLKEICRKKDILLLEDNAESLGSSFNGRKAGTFGDGTILSFCQNKIITTGEGGMLLTDSDEVAEKAKFIRSHGRVDKDADYFSSTEDNDYAEIGYNYRMSAMQAALGIAQFKKMDRLINLRREAAKQYRDNLDHIEEITFPLDDDAMKNVYQMFFVRLPNENMRNGLQKHLADHGIMTKVYFNLVHRKSSYQKRGAHEISLPVAEHLSKTILTLPMHPKLSGKDIEFICESIKEFFKGDHDRRY